MELAGKVAVVTGGAAGIGRALCRRFAREGAHVIVSDVDAPGAARVALEVEGLAVAADVSVEADVVGLVETVLTAHGHIDLFCSNAGILMGSEPDDPAAPVGPEAPDEDWERMWRVNLRPTTTTAGCGACAAFGPMDEGFLACSPRQRRRVTGSLEEPTSIAP